MGDRKFPSGFEKMIQDGFLSGSQTIKFDQQCIAVEDGFIVTNVRSTADNTHGWARIFISEKDSLPYEAIAVDTSVCFDTGVRNCYLGWAGSTVPVQANAYYLLKNAAVGSVDCQATLFVLRRSSFDAPRTILAEEIFKPQKNGFLFGSVSRVNAGDRAALDVLNERGDLLTGASMQWSPDSTLIPYNSFCLPVYGGNTYIINPVTLHGSPEFITEYIAMNGDLTFATPSTLRTGSRYKAGEFDGFIVACLQAVKNGDRSHLAVYVNRNTDNLDEESSVRARTAIHYNKDSDTYVGLNSVLVPIAKGEHYRCMVDDTCGLPRHLLCFIPVVVKGQGRG